MQTPDDTTLHTPMTAAAPLIGRRIHRFALFTAAWILALIFLGGQVKSTNSGLSVPDWPNTYNHFMFSFPWEKMVGGIFWEHTHRMVASVAGLLTFALTFLIYRYDRRRWVRTLGLFASIAVLAQGVLGGITVLMYLPVSISSGHGTLAQIYLCLVVAVAMVTSPRWRDDLDRANPAAGGVSLRKLTVATTITIFVQLIIGALMRHSDAGLAVPDFPTMFGSWVPPLGADRLAAANRELISMDLHPMTLWQMSAHLLHRFGAVVVTTMVLWTAARTWRASRGIRELRVPTLGLLALLCTQVTLGILTILTEKQFTITSLHVVNGAATLATSLVLTIRVRHHIAAEHTAPADVERDVDLRIRPTASSGGAPVMPDEQPEEVLA